MITNNPYTDMRRQMRVRLDKETDPTKKQGLQVQYNELDRMYQEFTDKIIEQETRKNLGMDDDKEMKNVRFNLLMGY